MDAEGMAFKLVFALFLCLFPSVLSQDSNDVMVIVNGFSIEAEIDDSFVCVTLDWWPTEKCNYNQCPWGNASVLNLDLNHPYLYKAIKAFCPLRVRVGGSLQDQVLYDIGDLESPCDPFTYTSGGLFGFSKGCLSMERWDDLNRLFQITGAVVTFGLNALYGRHQGKKGVWLGAWNSSNSHDFIKHTSSKGYPVDSWEFGNELSGSGVSARVDVQQYGKDLISLKAIIDEIYSSSWSKPLIVAPGGFFDNQHWYEKLLDISGPGVLNGMSHHVYNLGAGNDPRIASRILNPEYLSRFVDTFRKVQLTIERHGPWSSAWVSESGGAYNSGSQQVSNTFLNSFWYLDQLGMAAKFNTRVYCRQTLIGGNYGLLDLMTFTPNPDYYSALLWHQLMGKRVLHIDISGSPSLRAYAHCRKHNTGVSVLLINLNKSAAYNVVVSGESVIKQTVPLPENKTSDGSQAREEYHLTGKDGNYLSRTVLLNGIPLQLTKDGDIPDFTPVLADINSPIRISPISIAFVVFPNLKAPACA